MRTITKQNKKVKTKQNKSKHESTSRFCNINLGAKIVSLNFLPMVQHVTQSLETTYWLIKNTASKLGQFVFYSVSICNELVSK